MKDYLLNRKKPKLNICREFMFAKLNWVYCSRTSKRCNSAIYNDGIVKMSKQLDLFSILHKIRKTNLGLKLILDDYQYSQLKFMKKSILS
jgi:hypothetical protein